MTFAFGGIAMMPRCRETYLLTVRTKQNTRLRNGTFFRKAFAKAPGNNDRAVVSDDLFFNQPRYRTILNISKGNTLLTLCSLNLFTNIYSSRSLNLNNGYLSGRNKNPFRSFDYFAMLLSFIC